MKYIRLPPNVVNVNIIQLNQCTKYVRFPPNVVNANINVTEAVKKLVTSIYNNLIKLNSFKKVRLG